MHNISHSVIIIPADTLTPYIASASMTTLAQSCPSTTCTVYQHIESKTKWRSFCGHFQIHFLVRKLSYVASNLTKSLINTLRPRQNGRHFPDEHLNCIFLNENKLILINISLKFVPKGRINNIPALVQIMAWRRLGDKPLSEPMMVGLLTHICVTRPQWVNIYPALIHVMAWCQTGNKPLFKPIMALFTDAYMHHPASAS